MKNTFFLLTLILTGAASYGQIEKLNYTKALKAYNLTSFEEQVVTTLAGAAQTSVQFEYLRILHPTIAFQWKAGKNNFHEIELTSFSMSKQKTSLVFVDQDGNPFMIENGAHVMNTLISVRYEYIANLWSDKNKKLIPGMGFSINPYFSQANYLPQVGYAFPTFVRKAATMFFIVPRLTYHISPRLFLDANMPIAFTDISIDTRRIENPVIPIQQRTVTTFNMVIPPHLMSFRIGIGVKI